MPKNPPEPSSIDTVWLSRGEMSPEDYAGLWVRNALAPGRPPNDGDLFADFACRNCTNDLSLRTFRRAIERTIDAVKKKFHKMQLRALLAVVDERLAAINAVTPPTREPATILRRRPQPREQLQRRENPTPWDRFAEWLIETQRMVGATMPLDDSERGGYSPAAFHYGEAVRRQAPQWILRTETVMDTNDYLFSRTAQDIKRSFGPYGFFEELEDSWNQELKKPPEFRGNDEGPPRKLVRRSDEVPPSAFDLVYNEIENVMAATEIVPQDWLADEEDLKAWGCRISVAVSDWLADMPLFEKVPFIKMTDGGEAVYNEMRRLNANADKLILRAWKRRNFVVDQPEQPRRLARRKKPRKEKSKCPKLKKKPRSD